MIYIVSDIHGCLKTLQKSLENVNFNEKEDKLYILGDIVDRGPYIWETYQWVKERIGESVFMILGNHEYELINDVYTKKGLEIMKNNLPIITTHDKKYVEVAKKSRYVIDNYHTILSLMQKGITLDELVEMCEFFDRLPLYYILDINGKTYRLVHAYCRKEIDETPKEDIVWARNFSFSHEFCYGENVIFGHTPTINFGTREAIVEEDTQIDATKINIDCGCVYGNQLCLLRLDDFKFFYQKDIDMNLRIDY